MALVYETLGKTRVREGENPEREFGNSDPGHLAICAFSVVITGLVPVISIKKSAALHRICALTQADL
jgi:bisphosphoglycerate-independent phosphoglycerate mutase (AlkP superfamily)